MDIDLHIDVTFLDVSAIVQCLTMTIQFLFIYLFLCVSFILCETEMQHLFIGGDCTCLGCDPE